MKRKTETEVLHRQLKLLAEDSKNTYPASNKLSQNSIAMAEISKELFKRKWLPAVLFVTLYYLAKGFPVHRYRRVGKKLQ